MGLSLSVRKNIKEFETKKEENLKKIESILKVQLSFECNFDAIYELTPDSFKNDLGKIIYDQYLGGLAENLAKIMADEMAIETFLAAITAKKIVFMIEELDYSIFIRSSIIDGALCLVANKKHFPCNFKQTGADLEKVL